MRCLLDKVTARYILQGLLKLAENRNPTIEEMFALDLFSRADSEAFCLFITPPAFNILQKLAQMPKYSELIHLFLEQIEVALPSRYFKRWARRLRKFGFSREDAAVLASASFSTDREAVMLGMRFVATFDQPMMRHWLSEQKIIRKRFTAMKKEIPRPYCRASLPEVLRPEQINA